MSPRPKRTQQVSNLPAAIKAAAWQQIATFGVPALSLRAIGRALRITAPAIYNYFPDRDALVTALIIDAFSSFGEALAAARDSRPEGEHAARFAAIGHAYRAWSVSHPQHFALIFGTPVAGYDLKQAELGPAPMNSFLILVGVLDEAQKAGALHPPEGYVRWTPALQVQARTLCNLNLAQDPLAVYLGVEVWAKVHGLAALELYGHLPDFLEQSLDDFWHSEIDAYTRLLFGK